MLGYFNLFLQKSWFFKTNNWSFCNKTTQDFAEFWEILGNFRAKTKTEDEGILKKGKWSSSWFFSLHIGLTEREENEIFCHAKRANDTVPRPPSKNTFEKNHRPVSAHHKEWFMIMKILGWAVQGHAQALAHNVTYHRRNVTNQFLKRDILT